jgi:hypothetical protein
MRSNIEKKMSVEDMAGSIVYQARIFLAFSARLQACRLLIILFT